MIYLISASKHCIPLCLFSTRLNRALLAESFAVCDSRFIILPDRGQGWASSGYVYAAVAVGMVFMYSDLNKSQIRFLGSC